MKKTWTALVPFRISIQCPVVICGYLLHNYVILLIQKHLSGKSRDNEWINLQILNTSAATVCNSFWCNEKWLFVFKIFIPTSYCLQKRTLTEMTIRYNSLSLVVTCRHLLSRIIISCHSLYHLLLFVVIMTRLHFYQIS